MELRSYQKKAISLLYAKIKGDSSKNYCLVLPTGAGKTPIISRLASDAVKCRKKCIVVTHTKELVKQNYETLG